VAGVEYFLSTQQLLEIAFPPTVAQLDAVAKAAQFHLSFQEICKRRYAASEGLIRKKYWAQCVIQCLEIFESAMKYLLRGLLSSPQDSRTKKAILATEKTILGKVPRGWSASVFEDFTLPQMIRLYSEAELFPELKKQLCDPFYRTTTSTNWHKLEVLWYQTKDASGVTPCGEDDARDIAFWTKNLLYESKILGVDIRQRKPAIPSNPINVCASCNSSTTEDWHFCPQCGYSLKLECMACHKALQAEWRRCPYCDSPVRKTHETSADIHKLEDEYRTLSRGAWLDGVVSIRERRLLDEKRLELGLGSDVADRIERECAPPNVVEYSRFVEGVLVDGIITDVEREFLDKKALQLGIDPWIAKQTEETLLATTVR
jgi:RNA polymerase subunit RPABC4/transcription elongation factor Spt4